MRDGLEEETGLLAVHREIAHFAMEETATGEGSHRLSFHAEGLRLLDGYDRETLDRQGGTTGSAAYQVVDLYNHSDKLPTWIERVQSSSA